MGFQIESGIRKSQFVPLCLSEVTYYPKNLAFYSVVKDNLSPLFEGLKATQMRTGIPKPPALSF